MSWACAKVHIKNIENHYGKATDICPLILAKFSAHAELYPLFLACPGISCISSDFHSQCFISRTIWGMGDETNNPPRQLRI